MPDDSANRRLKIEAHDASRVEWSIYIPLPRGPSVSEAEVSLRLEFPENVYVPHDGWEQLQILARLSSPDEESPAPEPLTVDGLRRSRSEEHTSELQSRENLVCRLLLEKKNNES